MEQRVRDASTSYNQLWASGLCLFSPLIKCVSQGDTVERWCHDADYQHFRTQRGPFCSIQPIDQAVAISELTKAGVGEI